MQTTDPSAETIQLNEQQRRAVVHAVGPLMVLAGPGTGKTRVIIERIASLIQDRHADPSAILAVTFTVKAAEQMRRKLAERLRDDARAADKVRIRTFHGFGRELLHRFGDYLGLPGNLVLMDSAQRRRLLRAVIAEEGLYAHAVAQGLDTAVERTIAFINRCRECDRTPEDALAHAAAWKRAHDSGGTGLWGDALIADGVALRAFEAGARAFERFERECIGRGWITFDDYIAHPIRLLRAHGEVASVVRTESRHIVVDEFQDVNPAQIALLQLIAPPERNPDLCVVGDDDQAIYAFRGADPRAMEHFKRVWTGCAIEKLETNYRSAARIIGLANEIISSAARIDPDKRSRVPDDEPNGLGMIEVLTTDDQNPRDAVIPAMILMDQRATGRAFRDYAVLTRLTIDADRTAAALRMHGIPVTLREKRTPLEDPGVQDVLSWIRVLSDAQNTADVQRLLARPPVALALSRVSRLASDFAVARREHKDERSFIEWLRAEADDARVASWIERYDDLLRVAGASPADRAIDEIIRRTGVVQCEESEREQSRRVQNLVPVIQFARRVQPFLDPPRDLGAFLSYYNDLDPKERDFSFNAGVIDAEDNADDAEQELSPDAVSILTAHRAKGLEFDTVFVMRCNPGHGFPQSRAADEDPLPLEFSKIDPSARTDEERRLFYVACTRAERRLVLTTKLTKATSEKNFVHQLRASLDPAMDESIEHDWLKKLPLGAADPMDQGLSAAGEPETDARDAILRGEFVRARQSALAALHEIECSTIGVPARPAMERLRDAASTIAALAHLREHHVLPAAMTGLTEDAREQLLRIAQRAKAADGPVWPMMSAPLRLSFSKISDYLACPRCFLVKHVLGLDEPKTEELSVGHVVHVALERFFKAWQLADGEGTALPTRDRLLALCDEALRAESRTYTPRDDEYRALREQVEALALNALEKLHDNANILHIEQWVEFPYEAGGKRHRFVAKLDRVDQLANGRFRIVDYKTGQSSKRLLNPDKKDLQMAIYAMAMPTLLDDPGFEVGGGGGVAEYWLLRTGERGVLGFDAIAFDKARAQIDGAIAGILAGDYTRNESKCKGLCEIIG